MAKIRILVLSATFGVLALAALAVPVQATAQLTDPAGRAPAVTDTADDDARNVARLAFIGAGIIGVAGLLGLAAHGRAARHTEREHDVARGRSATTSR